MRRRHLSLYVEWTDEADANAVRALLQRRGVCVVGTDEGTDIRPESDPLIRHENTVFRILAGRSEVVELLTEIAMHPAVYSVCQLP